MLTAGIDFLNHAEYLSQPLNPFISVEDVIAARNINKERNQSNNSSYVTKGDNHIIQIYGKTYGANKYETTLFCIAFSRISNNQIELYQICEQDLKAIPQRCANVISSLGNVRIIQTDLTMERNSFEKTIVCVPHDTFTIYLPDWVIKSVLSVIAKYRSWYRAHIYGLLPK